MRGFLTNATNPKALLFFAAILSQFIGTGAGTLTMILATTVVLGAALWWAGAVALGRALGLGRSPRADRIVTLIGGLTLIAAAVVLGTLTVVDPNGYLG